MEAERWRDLRHLFDAVCDQPSSRWEESLRSLSDDPFLIGEALGLLQAQTASFDQALQPLRELMDSLSEAELRVGDSLGVWHLVERLASGGMGTVFVAERADGLFRQRVAIKLLRGSALAGTDVAERLAAERQLLAELQHPNIARLYDGGSTPGGRPYLVMEHVAGLPLDRYCDVRQPGLSERLRLFLRICRAVQSAHERLIVHCDLKPGNVLVREDGEPVLLDFGIAQVLGHGEDGDASHYCTPAYASPELLGGSRVSVVSDVFSLGLLLVELLACRPLGRGLADRHVPVPRPSAWVVPGCGWRRGLRGDLDAISERACALAPERRYSSVAALAGDIERHLARRPVAARAATPGYRLGRLLQRNWVVAMATGLVLVSGGVFVWRVASERARAEREAVVAEQVSEFLVAAFDAADPRMRGAHAGDISARQVLDASAQRLEDGLDASPAIQARLRAVIGRAYRNLGQPQQAEALLARAADAFLDPAVARPDRAAQAFNELALAYGERQYGEQAVSAAQRALALRERLGDVGMAEAHATLGLAHAANGDYAAAEQALERSLLLRRARAGDPAPHERADTLGHLASLYRQRGELERAERSLREALAIRRRDPARPVDLQADQYALSRVLFLQGRVTETRDELIDNLALARDLYGEDSSVVANLHVDLANTLQDLGTYRESDRHYGQALAIMARVAGEDSLDYARILNNHASLHDARGDVAKAEDLWRRALAVRRTHLPDDERRVLRVESILGRLLARSGRLEQGMPLLDRAAAVWRTRHPDDHAGNLMAQLNLVEGYLAGNRLDQAGAALETIDPGRGEHNRLMALRIDGLHAELAQRRGRWREAGAAWEQAIAAFGALLGADQITTAKARLPYAEVLLANGDVVGAGEQLRRTAPVLRRELAPGADLLRRLEALEGAMPRPRGVDPG